jgi:hypothetical protein
VIDSSTIERLLKEQHSHCARCWRAIPPFQVHHAVYGREKRFQKYLDMPENLQLLCPTCHAKHGYLLSWFARCAVWTDKINAGYDMEKWHAEIPMLIHDQFIYLEPPERNSASLMWDVAERTNKNE